MNWLQKCSKTVLAAASALVIVGLVAGCGASTKQGNTEVPKKIVIGLDDNFPPMGFKDEKGELVGFDIDLAKEVAKRIGTEVEFKSIDWDSKEAELKSKRIDVLWNGLTITKERERNILFSKPYLRGDQIIAVKSDSGIADKAQLDGKRVGVQSGSTGLEAVKNDPQSKNFKEIKEYGDYVNAFMDLELGRIDAIVVDEMVGRYLIGKKGNNVFTVATGSFASEKVGVGMRKDEGALKEKVDAALQEVMNDGTADKLAQKWFGSTSILTKEEYK